MRVSKESLFTVGMICMTDLLSARRILDCKRCAAEDLLRSPAFGIAVNAEHLKAAVKKVDGTVSSVTTIETSDETRGLMRAWEEESIALHSDDINQETETLEDDPHSSQAEALGLSLIAPIQSIFDQVTKTSLPHLRYALTFPPFIPLRYIDTVRKAAQTAGLPANDTGRVYHADEAAFELYNSLSCSYHVHPHNPRCATDEEWAFDTLVAEVGVSLLTVTWLLSNYWRSPILRRGGFVVRMSGNRSRSDADFSAEVTAKLTSLARSVDAAHPRTGDGSIPFPERGRNQVIILGERKKDDTVWTLFRETLSGTQFDFDTVGMQDSFDPVFASAFGAASMEKGIMDAPDPSHCDESFECVTMRERIYEEAKSRPRDEL